MVATSLNLSRSLLKREGIAKVHDQNLLHAMLLQAVFPLPEEFQFNISDEIKFGGSAPQLYIHILQELLLPHNDSKLFFFR